MEMRMIVLIVLAIILAMIISLLISILKDLLEQNHRIKVRRRLDVDNLVVTRRPKKEKKKKVHDSYNNRMQVVYEENIRMKQKEKARLLKIKEQNEKKIAKEKRIEEKRLAKEEKRLAKLEAKEQRKLAKQEAKEQKFLEKEERRLAKEEAKELKREEKLRRKEERRARRNKEYIEDDGMETYVRIKFHGSDKNFIFVAPEDIELVKGDKIRVKVDDDNVRTAKVLKGNYRRERYKTYDYKTLELAE